MNYRSSFRTNGSFKLFSARKRLQNWIFSSTTCHSQSPRCYGWQVGSFIYYHTNKNLLQRYYPYWTYFLCGNFALYLYWLWIDSHWSTNWPRTSYRSPNCRRKFLRQASPKNLNQAAQVLLSILIRLYSKWV